MASPTSPTTSSMPSANAPLQPTWSGFVADTREALVLFEAVMQGQLNRVVRRPHDRERNNLIQSGSVFIYEENNSGIKRWTDGVPWSPSRILGNFLIYRELDKPFPPGEKKRAKKPGQRKESITDDGFTGIKAEEDGSLNSPQTPQTPITPGGTTDVEKDTERALVGSLTDSYAFKDGGLVKKTIAVTVANITYHLVSYYKPDDVKTHALPRLHNTNLRMITPRSELVRGQSFRAPLEEGEDMLGSPYAQHAQQQQQQRNPYGMQQPFLQTGPYMQHPQYSSMPPPPSPYYQQMPPGQDPYQMQHMQHHSYHHPSMQHQYPPQMSPYSPQQPQSPYANDPRFRQQQHQQSPHHSGQQSPYSPQNPNMQWQQPPPGN